MVYKRLLISISIRIILLTINILALVWFWFENRDPLILLNLLALMVLQLFLFIRSQNQVNRKLKVFFEAFKFNDLGFTTGDGFRDKSFSDLYASMSDILVRAQAMNLENQREKQYFQTVTEHAGVGILACNEKQEIRMINKTFKNLLGITELLALDELNRIQDGFSIQLENIKPGEQKLIQLSVRNPADITGETRMQLSVRCAEIKLEKEKIRLFTFQNINSELEEKEVESWQRVIRVLTHEITNSTGPIASAAQTLLELLENDESADPEQAGIIPGLREDLLEGLKIIRERSTGMEDFVQQFRKVSLIPKPKIEKIIVRDLFLSISLLFELRLREDGIAFEWNTESPDMALFADRNLIEQALINLMSNAIEALASSSHKTIRMDARVPEGKQCLISITDSGRGIPEEDLDKVFIPFFTSREAGSGIGLSLVRNIMIMHRGSIHVSSDPGVQTTFRMVF